VLKTDAITLEFINHLKEAMDSQMALKDAMALAKARMAPDDMEKVLESTGPIVEDMSRSMEPPMREIANQVKYLILQYYTTPRVMQIVGPNDIPEELFDYNPAELTPSHMPGENPDLGKSAADSVTRAKALADNLRFFITPRSLHELTQMAMKLGLIQLRKAGVQIDSQTIAEAWSVPNYGDIPGSTVREKWENEQQQNLEFAAKMKELGASLSGAGSGLPPGAAGPGKNPEGRPPSGQAAPHLVQKDGGARSTIAESK
jgi:hypothetical protein